MFTPQEIQEQTFSKAVFGGYDMQQVDDFLEPLTEDYITLYKENSVLKAKMKILVEKLEEYRAQETQQSSATAEAEAKSAQLLKQTQAKCAAMLQNAEVNAQANAQVNAANVQLAQLNQQIHAEQERLDYAKQTALNFISVIERDVQGHLGLLETLKSRDLTKEEAPSPAEVRARKALRLAGRQDRARLGPRAERQHRKNRVGDLRQPRKADRQRAGDEDRLHPRPGQACRAPHASRKRDHQI